MLPENANEYTISCELLAIVVQTPMLNFTCLTLFTKINLNKVKHAKCRTDVSRNCDRYTTICELVAVYPTPMFNFTCLTLFTQINLNKVKHAKCGTDVNRNACNIPLVVNYWQSGFNTRRGKGLASPCETQHSNL